MIHTNGSTLYMPDVSYYLQHSFISNSGLKEVRDWLWTRDGNGKKIDLTQAYNFGNLLDAIITEPGLVDRQNLAVTLAFGETVSFSPEVFAKAERMRDQAYKDPDVALIMRNMDFQAEYYYDVFPVEYEGRTFFIPVRIKMDGDNQRMRIGMDLKSTQCTTYKSFVESLEHFDYDQQGAMYTDVAELDKFWFIGVGKTPLRNGLHPIFKYCFKRGDEFYNRGRRKYTFWADKYEKLIYQLDTTLFQHG